MRQRSRSAAAALAFALGATAAAVAIRWLLDPWLGDRLALVTLYASVAASAWFGGAAAGIVAALTGFVACDLLFIAPRGHIAFDGLAGLIGLGAYVLSCTFIVTALDALRTSRERLAERERLLRITLASIGDGVLTTDAEGRVTFLNDVAETLTGWTRREAEGQPIGSVFFIVDESTRQPAPNPALRALAEGRLVGLANHSLLLARDGVERPIDDSAAPIRDEHGSVEGCVLVFRDVSSRRDVERAIARREQEHRDFFDNAPVALHWVGPDGTVLRVNQCELDLLGYARDEVVGRNVADFHADAESIREILQCLTSGQTLREYEARLRCRDGSIRHVVISSNVLWENDRFVHTRCFTRDVTRRKQAEQALRESEQALHAADRRKDEFIAMLSHELRNPLAPVRNSLEILKFPDLDARTLERVRATMERQVSQMERLIDDLLDISRITRNRLELRMQPLELASLVHHVVEACRPRAESGRLQFSVALPDEPVYVNGDPVRLAQVFGNLLNNACKYTGPGGRIRLAAERDEGTVVVSVQDSGIGIPAEMLPSIFDTFTQVDRRLERPQGGLGLGLSLVRQLVEKHGGSVQARSEGPGRGSVFRVRLPAVARVPEPQPPPPRAGRDRPTPSRRILVVDDNRDSAESMALLLQLDGHVTRLCHDGLEAVELAGEFRPDIVLLDIGLPKLNGYDACRRMRREPWGRGMLVVALTGWGQESDRLRSRDAGFDHHLLKPVDRDKLMSLVGSLRGETAGC